MALPTRVSRGHPKSRARLKIKKPGTKAGLELTGSGASKTHPSDKQIVALRAPASDITKK
jgi:hypothetical protein